MVLGIDIGNSNVVIGYMLGTEITHISRFETDARMPQEVFCRELKKSMGSCLRDCEKLSGAIISSVVRPLTAIARHCVRLLTGLEPLTVSPRLKTGLSFSIDSPERLGCDRIADCAAAAQGYALPAVVADFGTATTLSVIGRDGSFLGGAIAPGLKMSAAALTCGTSQLQPATIAPPRGCIGTDTEECIKSGVIIGTAAMLDGMVRRIEKSLGEPVTRPTASAGSRSTRIFSCAGLRPFTK